jgi:hypothetical protein
VTPTNTPLTKVATGMASDIEMEEAERRGYEDGRYARVNCDPYEGRNESLSYAYGRGWDQGYEEYLCEDGNNREDRGGEDIRIVF